MTQPILRVRLLRPEAKLPVRAHPTDSGADAFACADVVPSQCAQMVPLGIACDIPPGYELQIRPRSGLSKKGVHCALGTVDQGYTGELKAIVWWSWREGEPIRRGDRICQLVLAPVALPEIVQVDEIGETARGANGFGSSGR